MYRKYFKRFIDFIMALCTILILLPIFLIVAILIKIKLGSPIIFKQNRPGLNEKLFTLYKFRSMANAKDANGNELTDEQRLSILAEAKEEDKLVSDNSRLSKFGKFLRSTSLDELPELYNILIGDMSFVGPRPLSTLYLPYYNEKEKLRHTVRPGLTGLAQVNGRNAISWEKRFEYDITYVENISFIGDIKIILKTIAVTFSRENINQADEKPVAFHILRQQDLDKELSQIDTIKEIS